ncbi:hypothetical protein ACP275_04G027600 [Erythranthe tilingii]
MDFSMITPRTCVLKVNFHCPACEKKVYKALQKINGVRTIEIDGRNGKVTVSGSADPYTLQKALSKIGKRAEIMWDSSKASVNQHTANQNRSISVSQTQEIDPRQLEQLSKIKRLKQVELTKTIKFTFNDDDGSCPDLDTCTSQFYADDHFNGRQVVPSHHRLGGGSGGGTAHGCCCHNNHSNRAMNNNNYYHGGNGGCGSTRALPPADRCDHWRSGYGPSAPPALPPPRQMPPPPQQYSHYGPNYFSDENPNGCRLI